MSEFFRALEQAGRDREERLAKQRNDRKPPVAAEPPAQPEPEVTVVAKASKPRKDSGPAAAPKPAPTPEPKVVAVAPTSTPRNEPRPPVAVAPAARVEPEVAMVAAAVEVEPEPEIGTNIEPEMYTELEPAFYAEVEAEIHADVEPEIHADVEPEIHAYVEPEIHADVEPEIHEDVEPEIHAEVEADIHAEVEAVIHAEVAPEIEADVEPEIRAEVDAEDEAEFETAVAAEAAMASTPMPFAMRPADAPAFTESVPTVKDDDAESVDDRLVTLLTPNSFAGEQYRTLRHLVEKMHTETGVSVVGVSSPSIGDGKTTTAINLAGALAQARETKVLLIDMDLRRPAVNGQLGLRGFNPKGVVAVLGAGASLDDVIVELPMFNLSIIPSGPRQSAPYELLKSSRLHQMMDEARRRFDYVIVDTPPVIAVPDCRVISSGVDGFLIIVNAHRTPTRLLSETVSVLGQSKVLGLIFNRDDQPIAEHLYNSYGPDPSGGWTGSIRRRLRRNGQGNGNTSGNGTGYLSGNGITH